MSIERRTFTDREMARALRKAIPPVPLTIEFDNDPIDSFVQDRLETIAYIIASNQSSPCVSKGCILNLVESLEDEILKLSVHVNNTYKP